MADKVEFIIVHETVLKSWARDASMFAFVLATVGLGYLMQSRAMEWIGFIVFWAALAFRSKTKRLTVTQARAELDRIEKEMARP